MCRYVEVRSLHLFLFRTNERKLFLADVLEEFRRQFESRKDMPAMKPHAPPWSFNPSAVFTRFDAFLRRLNDIEWLFNTVMEFSKLEKIEIGGIQGGSLSARITSVYKEFQNLFVSFTVRANDALEPDDQSFTENCAKFNESITDLDSKLAAILCQAFDDCGNLESIFKVSSCHVRASEMLAIFLSFVLAVDKYRGNGFGQAGDKQTIHESLLEDLRAVERRADRGRGAVQSRDQGRSD